MKNKQSKTIAKKYKRNPREKVCECCGNGGFTAKPVFKCRFCGHIKGVSEAVVTKGGIDEH